MRKVPRVLWSYRDIVLKPVNGPSKMSMNGCRKSLRVLEELYGEARAKVLLSLNRDRFIVFSVTSRAAMSRFLRD